MFNVQQDTGDVVHHSSDVPVSKNNYSSSITTLLVVFMVQKFF